MSFVRVDLTPGQLVDYKPTIPLDLNPHPVQALLDTTSSGSHVKPVFAFAVAADLLGLDFVLATLKEAPRTLGAWVTLIETHGWGVANGAPMNLQMSLLANAIKSRARITGLEGIKLEGVVYELITATAGEDQALTDVLINALITTKGKDVPWVLVVRN